MKNNSKYSAGSDNDSGLSMGKEVLSSFSSNHSNTKQNQRGNTCQQSVYLKIFIVDLSKHVKYEFSVQNSVFDVKRALLRRYSQRLVDPINYGLFIPHQVDKAGKFLQEERLLSEYVSSAVGAGASGNPASRLGAGTLSRLEFIYKSRILWPDKSGIGDAQKKINSKVNHSRFIEYIIRNDPEKVKKALSKGLDPNFHCSSGETPLTLTARLTRKSREMITALVAGGAHLDYRAADSLTPLHKAAMAGNLETVTTLLDFGASANCVDNSGLTPLYYNLLGDSSVKCAEKLLFEHAKMGVVDRKGLKEIHQTCRLGKADHLDVLLAYEADIDARTESHLSTPLHVAAYTGKEDCVRLLLVRGADRSLLNNQGRTAAAEARLIAANSPDSTLVSAGNNIASMIRQFRDAEIHTKPSFKPTWNQKRRRSEFDVTSAHLKMRLATAGGPQDGSTTGSHETASSGSGTNQRGRRRSAAAVSKQKPIPAQMTGSTSSTSVRLHKSERCASQGAIAKSMSYSVFSDPDDASATSDPKSNTNSNREKRPVHRYRDDCWRHSSMLSLDSDSMTDSDLGSVREVVLQKSTQDHYGIDLDDALQTRGPSQYMVKNVELGSPAFLAGIRSEDFLLEVNGADVRHGSINAVRQLFGQHSQTVLLKVVHQSNRSHYSDASTDPSLHYEQFVYSGPSACSTAVDAAAASQLAGQRRSIIRNAASVDNLLSLSAVEDHRHMHSQQHHHQQPGTCESSTTLNSICTLLAPTTAGSSDSSPTQHAPPAAPLSHGGYFPQTGCFTLGRRNRSQSTDKKFLKASTFKQDPLLKYRPPLAPGPVEGLKPILKNSGSSCTGGSRNNNPYSQLYTLSQRGARPSTAISDRCGWLPGRGPAPPAGSDLEPAMSRRAQQPRIGGGSRDSSGTGKLSASEEEFGLLPPPPSFQ